MFLWRNKPTYLPTCIEINLKQPFQGFEMYLCKISKYAIMKITWQTFTAVGLVVCIKGH